MPALQDSHAEAQMVSLSDYRGRWLALTFFWKDFSFLCPVELLTMSDRIAEYNDLGVSILGVSSDSSETHRKFLEAPREERGVKGLSFPIAADENSEVAAKYGILSKIGVPLRALFLIDPNGIVQYVTIHQLNVGRSVDEILRIVEALQTGGICTGEFQRGMGVPDYGRMPEECAHLVYQPE